MHKSFHKQKFLLQVYKVHRFDITILADKEIIRVFKEKKLAAKVRRLFKLD